MDCHLQDYLLLSYICQKDVLILIRNFILIVRTSAGVLL